MVVEETLEKTKQLASDPSTDIFSSDQKKTERWKSSVMEGHASDNSRNDGNNSDVARQSSSPIATEEDKNIQGTGHSLTAESGDRGQAQLSGNERTQSMHARIEEQLTHREDCES